MSDLLSLVHVVLQSANYRTWDISASADPAIGFEDQAAMGFVCVMDTPRRIVDSWNEIETRFLNRHAAHFRAAGEKAWNVYSVFLTEASGSAVDRLEVRWIEENLERTRKITATNVNSRADLARALLPLLPIVAKPLLRPEDSTQRLLRRVESISPGIQGIVLSETVNPVKIVEKLRGRQ